MIRPPHHLSCASITRKATSWARRLATPMKNPRSVRLTRGRPADATAYDHRESPMKVSQSFICKPTPTAQQADAAEAFGPADPSR